MAEAPEELGPLNPYFPNLLDHDIELGEFVRK